MSEAAGVVLRSSEDDDVEAIAAIYAHYVATGLASFEEVPPGSDEIARRRANLLARGLPYSVAILGGRVVGYAYAAPYRARPAYRFTLEDTVYVAPDAQRRGIGRRLLADILDASAASGCHQMIAVIGDSANAGSIRLHAGAGFRAVGTLEAVGFKFGRWVDTVLMQRPLGPGSARPPD